MRSKRRIAGNILLILGLLSLLVAGGLCLYNLYEDNEFYEDSFELTSDIKAYIGSADPEEEDLEDIYTDRTELEPVDVKGYPSDGYLLIPSIELETAVLDTWNNRYLRKAVCRYYGSPYPHDFVIAGHNFRRGFGKLKKLSPGDDVYFTDMKGNVTSYTVSQIEVIDGGDVEGMLSGGWDLSLYTCTFGGKARLTVRCEENQ